ncbi:MAG: glycosyltransferase family 4 protein [Candidatus Marinimicrobia bacterium]|nr:glycosyltransferase family 4 protein [Candidatus Neomarinimicrobiota bacterium]
MKILFLSHYFPPEVNAPANRTYEHTKRWIKKGHSVTVITNFPNHPGGAIFSGYKNRWLYREIIDGIEVIRVKTYLTPNRGTIRRTINFIVYFFMSIIASFYVKSVDAIIATSPQFFCGLAGSVIKTIKNKPFLLEIRDLWPDSIIAVNAVRKNILISILYFLEKRMYFSASRIVTVTKGLSRHIIKYGFPRGKVFEITNGVDFEHISVMNEYTNIFKKDNEFIVAYIGTFGLAHNLYKILDCAAMMKDRIDIQFLLIGDGAERNNILQYRLRNNLENVTILPIQPKERIPYFISRSDIGIVILKDIPLFQGALPSKLFEYLSLKTPVICSLPKGEATELVEHSDCGIAITPDSAQALVDAIMYMYTNPNRKLIMGENGYKLVKNQFNRDKLADDMLKVIEEMIKV